MDITEQYTKMAEKAIEIQNSFKERKNSIDYNIIYRIII